MNIQSPTSDRPNRLAASTASKGNTSPLSRSSSVSRFPTDMQTVSDKDLYLKSNLPPSGSLQITDPSIFEKDGIDWDSIQRCFAGTVTLDNADSLESTVDHIASLYVAAKHTIQNKYAGQEDKISEHMNRLDNLLAQAKNRMSASYKNTVGRFLDTTGNKGLGEAMGNSLPAAIDKKIQDIEAYGQKNGLFDKEKDMPYTMLQIALQVGAFNAREKGEPLNGTEEDNVSSGKEEGYTIKDLQAAGFMAKAASKMNPHELLLMGDEQLGIHLAIRYMKMAQVLNHSGISEDLASALLGSFETFLNKYSDGRLTGQKNASAPFQYAIKKFHSTGDIAKAMAQSAKKYLGDSFFSDFHNYGGEISMSMSTRYNLELSQFMTALEHGNTPELIKSIVGTGTHFTASYYA